MSRILAAAGVVLLIVSAVSPFVLAAMGPLSATNVALLGAPALAGAGALVLFALSAAHPTRPNPRRAR